MDLLGPLNINMIYFDHLQSLTIFYSHLSWSTSPISYRHALPLLFSFFLNYYCSIELPPNQGWKVNW